MASRRSLRAVVPVSLGVLALSMVLPVAMRFSVERFIFQPSGDVPQTEVAIVLGASVSHGAPSPFLAARADAAVALYKEGKVGKILVTGDNSALSHDEVTPVRKYLLASGVRAEDIFLDHAGFDTYSSMYRARDIFGARSAVIATQDFHLPRALFIARQLGIEAYGVRAAGTEGSFYDYAREIPASLKALWDVFTHRVPKYLGPAVPLSDDGRATWY